MFTTVDPSAFPSNKTLTQKFAEEISKMELGVTVKLDAPAQRFVEPCAEREDRPTEDGIGKYQLRPPVQAQLSKIGSPVTLRLARSSEGIFGQVVARRLKPGSGGNRARKAVEAA